jgi:viroplasmin and RNaseH domain-containing protein
MYKFFGATNQTLREYRTKEEAQAYMEELLNRSDVLPFLQNEYLNAMKELEIKRREEELNKLKTSQITFDLPILI